jgi:hypothetical protein
MRLMTAVCMPVSSRNTGFVVGSSAKDVIATVSAKAASPRQNRAKKGLRAESCFTSLSLPFTKIDP